jgi:hypothetical protein
MKKKIHILIVGLVIVFFSCGQSKQKQQMAVTLNDTLQTNLAKKEKDRVEKRNKIAEQDKIDSINLEKILKDAIEVVEQNKDWGGVEKKYVETMPDSSYQVEVSINYGFYFTKENPHFIIRRNTPGAIFVDIFFKPNRLLKKVLSHQQWGMTYVSDTIRDINGDGLKDFIVNWYGSSGCCLKAFSDVYLLRTDKKTFSNSFEFINPTFSPTEEIIRGVCYGHLGETEMYKYKWKGEVVDTLEYISYEKNDKGEKTGKIVVSNDRPYRVRHKILKRLNSVPDEYKKIEGYDWFTGTGYE